MRHGLTEHPIRTEGNKDEEEKKGEDRDPIKILRLGVDGLVRPASDLSVLIRTVSELSTGDLRIGQDWL